MSFEKAYHNSVYIKVIIRVIPGYWLPYFGFNGHLTHTALFLYPFTSNSIGFLHRFLHALLHQHFCILTLGFSFNL